MASVGKGVVVTASAVADADMTTDSWVELRGSVGHRQSAGGRDTVPDSSSESGLSINLSV